MTEKESQPVLQFVPFQSAVDEGFWHRLSSLKLNKFGVDESPIPITGMHPIFSTDFTQIFSILFNYD